VDASIKLDDLNDALHTKLRSDNYDSLGGLVIEVLDKLPREGDEAVYKNITLLVTKVNNNRIERITLTINSDEDSDNNTHNKAN
ncbi:MAG: hemolysin, partial [Lachnospiraceae bacterium]|nr:hemolysin [Lachnospiraceae bacterium]